MGDKLQITQKEKESPDSNNTFSLSFYFLFALVSKRSSEKENMQLNNPVGIFAKIKERL